MSDKLYPLSLSFLIRKSLYDLQHKDSYFGIPAALFFKPDPLSQAHRSVARTLFGQHAQTPLGVAAGPHTQMAQNILAAWLLGAGYIELKTVQTLDNINISKPCINMRDEGYNCEWSQELGIKESYSEYLHAWVGIHLLSHVLGHNEGPGVVFNMSVGYNLQGIMQENMQWFFSKMHDASSDIAACRDSLREIYPEIDKVNIPGQISDNVTLSTMHGCPAHEIESIAMYLMQQKQLHTYVKLNPTLLGPEKLKDILHKKLGFKTEVPDQAFGHDLKYDEAVKIIRNLTDTARKENREFGLKLSNTLESMHNNDLFADDVESMYMSGRALHPLTVNLAARLQHHFRGSLNLSFSGGADAFNVARLMACGFVTVTTCSDLLKPGGMMRLQQYIEQLVVSHGNQGLDGHTDKKKKQSLQLKELMAYASDVLHDTRYQRTYLTPPDVKTSRPLDVFDCISAPCRDSCATAQDIPEYICHASKGDFDLAHGVILRTNPFPWVTGMICDHLCQNKCTRVHYDDPLHIREIKRFSSLTPPPAITVHPPSGHSAAIIGAGPAGLSCAWFLALAGFSVDVYESTSRAGGMVRFAIPEFRLTHEAIDKDLERITGAGVRIHYNTKANSALFEKLRKQSHFVFVATGAPLSIPLNIPGIESQGVVDPIGFLSDTRDGEKPVIGRHVVIIGGGNTAMDAARTAVRLTRPGGSVKVVYRRTTQEMPADQGEIRAALDEGVEFIECTAPLELKAENNRVSALLCARTELKERDASGRPRPEIIKGSEFSIPCDTLIPAIGHLPNIGFMKNEELKTMGDGYLTMLENVYTGGDAMRGAATAIKAIGDGRKAAAAMCREAGIDVTLQLAKEKVKQGVGELMVKRAKRVYAPKISELPPEKRKGFELVQYPLEKDDIMFEASRCLHCDEVCSTCVTVCPNLAMAAFTIEPAIITMYKAVKQIRAKPSLEDDGTFEVKQGIQVLNIGDLCNHCGNCNTFCPSAGSPYKDKAVLHFSPAAFNQAESGYLLVRLHDRTNLVHKKDGYFKTLSLINGALIYETDYVVAHFEKSGFKPTEVRFLTPCVQSAGFREAAAMWVILQGALQVSI